MPKYLLFPDPITAHCELRFDNQAVVIGVPDEHSSHRKGQSMTIPGGTPQGNGVNLVINAGSGKAPINQRGTLWYQDGNQNFPFPEGDCFIWFDDFRLADIPTNPDSGNQNPNLDPLTIIKSIEATHQFDLTTHDGCGKFTEECCRQLHERHSVDWGHIKKFGAQEQYNHHAIDAIMLKVATPNTPAFIYDIIVNSQAPGAHAALNVASVVNEALWYYPA